MGALLRHLLLIHSPSFLAFHPYYDSTGNLISVLPPKQPSISASLTTTSNHTAWNLNRLLSMSANARNGSGTPPPPPPPSDTPVAPIRRLPCYNQIADAYVFQQTIDERLRRVGVTQTREDTLRLAGVQWIDGVRRALRLPVRTFDTAVVYYHKFRLVHSDGEYAFADAAAAALFAACKIEDTLKKSRDILCAAHNLKVARHDHLSPDDPIFESHSRTIIGLERLMLEASGFDFRSRHPQQLLIKLLKHHHYPKDSRVTRLAFKISLDLYRTFAPLKQCTAALAVACLELAVRLDGECEREEQNSSATRETNGDDDDDNNSSSNNNNSNNNTTRQITAPTSTLSRLEQSYPQWLVQRANITETLHDLLDLYIHYRSSTSLSSLPLDVFLQVRIPLNEEMDRTKLPRHTEWIEIHPATSVSQGHHSHSRTNGHGGRGDVGHRAGSGRSSKNVSPKDSCGRDVTSPSTNSSGAPGSGSTQATSIAGVSGVGVGGGGGGGGGDVGRDRERERDRMGLSHAGIAGPRDRDANGNVGIRQRIGERGRDGTVRFMLDPGRERMEREIVREFDDG